jgi:N-methylhydantoinase B
MVLEDVAGGFVSIEAAKRHYGVVVASDGALDAAATTALRAKRPHTRSFHRHGYVDVLT